MSLKEDLSRGINSEDETMFKFTPDEIEKMENVINQCMEEGISFSTKEEIIREIEIDDECHVLAVFSVINHNPG